MLLQQARKMRRIGGEHRGRLGDGLGRRAEILVHDVALRLADPIGHASGRRGEPDLGQCLDQLGGAVMGAVFANTLSGACCGFATESGLGAGRDRRPEARRRDLVVIRH